MFGLEMFSNGELNFSAKTYILRQQVSSQCPIFLDYCSIWTTYMVVRFYFKLNAKSDCVTLTVSCRYFSIANFPDV